MVRIEFFDKNMDELETVTVDMSIEKVVELIDKAKMLAVGTDRLRCEKTGYMAIDFQQNVIDVQVDF